jgi:hypothetical protein
MEPENIMENLFTELGAALKSLAKAKAVEEKVAHSQIVKNLSESLGVFLDFSDMIMNDEEEE